jgi:hypothetical protein
VIARAAPCPHQQHLPPRILTREGIRLSGPPENAIYPVGMGSGRTHPPAASRQDLQGRLAEDGYAVLRAAVGPQQVRAALRVLNLAIRRHGLSAEQIAEWQGGTFFPHLRWEPEIWDVLPARAAELLGWQEGDDWGDPQLLLRFPDEDQDWPLTSHVDEPPEWAGPEGYRGMVGVALTTAGADDGTVCVWPGSHAGRTEDPVLVPMEAGDALLMHPALAHAGTLNRGATIRTAVYFRLVAGGRAARAGR